MKKLIIFLVIIFLSLITTACTHDKAAILFNHNKITAENAMDYSFEFQPNQRIYYIIIIPKKIESRMIDIQIIKKDNSYQRLGYKLFWSYSAHLKDDQMYYYDDYVVIPEKGAYVMRVYSRDNPTKTLCMSQFFVK